MGFQSVHAGPLLDHHKRVGSTGGLKGRCWCCVDGRPVFDAPLLGQDRRHIGAEMLQHGLAHARLGGDDGQYMNHGVSPLFRVIKGTGSTIGLWVHVAASYRLGHDIHPQACITSHFEQDTHEHFLHG